MHVIITTGPDDIAAAALLLQDLSTTNPAASATILLTSPHPSPAALPTAFESHRVIRATELKCFDLRYIDLWAAGSSAYATWAILPAAIAATTHDATIDGPTLVIEASSRVLGDLTALSALVDGDEIAFFARHYDATHGVASAGSIPGLVVVGSPDAPALDWWQRRVVSDIEDPRLEALPFDPWAAHAMGGPAVRIITDPVWRVSPWAIESIDLDLDPLTGEVSVADQPVRLVGFGTFDVERPWRFATTADATPSVLTSEVAALRQLCEDYCAALREVLDMDNAGLDTDNAGPGGAAERVAVPAPLETAGFRHAFLTLLRSHRDNGTSAPNFFDPAQRGAFSSWLRGTSAARLTGVSVAADIVWAKRPDLAVAFPGVRWRDRARFVEWLGLHGVAEGEIDPQFLPDPENLAANVRPTVPIHKRPFGVNLIGYHDSGLGLGVAIRRTAAALDDARIPYATVSYDRTNSPKVTSGPASRSSEAPYRYNLILITPDQLEFFVNDLGEDILADRYTIGLWYWETDVMTDRQLAAFRFVDEVWGATQYLVAVFSKYSAKPVVRMPVPLEFEVGSSDAEARRNLGLDERFTFLFSYDYLSIAQRKNPEAVVDAYRTAFSVDEGCRLILKSMNGGEHLDDIERLRRSVEDRDDIDVWDRFLPAKARLDLMSVIDCYVSLHRSEGLGLTMAEAMAAGTPVIATAFSGNLDFMTPASSLLVDATVVPIGPGSFYPADGTWAEPDIEHAAQLMRAVRYDDDLRNTLHTAGPEALAPFSTKRVGARIAERLTSLDAKLSGRSRLRW